MHHMTEKKLIKKQKTIPARHGAGANKEYKHKPTLQKVSILMNAISITRIYF